MLSGSEANTLREKGVALILAPPLRVFWLRDWACKAGAEGEGEMSEATMLDPTPELPDDTPISEVEFPARIRNVLAAAGLKKSARCARTLVLPPVWRQNA